MSLYVRTVTRLASRLSRPPSKPLPRAESTRANLYATIATLRPGTRVLLLILGILFAGAGLLVPIAQKNAIDALTATPGLLTDAAWFFAASFVALVGSRALEMSVRMVGIRESLVVERWISNALYKKALTLKYESRHERTVGETVALMANHLSMVTFFLTDLFPAFFTAVIPVLVAPFVLGFYFDMPIYPVFGIVVASIVACFVFAKRQAANFQAYKRADEKRMGVINEWIQNIRHLRILSWVEPFEWRLHRATDEARVRREQMVGWGARMNAFSEAIPLLLNVVGILTLLAVKPNQPTPGELFGIVWVLGVFLAVPMRTLPWVFVISLDASTSFGRIHSFLSLPSDEDDERIVTQQREETPDSQPFALDHPVALQVEGLSLTLGQTKVLDDVSFTAKNGEFVAVVGDVGAGKTLLLHALTGEVPAQFAHYEVFGRPLEKLTRQQLRSVFAIAPQDAFTIEASVHENVRFHYDASPRQSDMEDAERSLQLVEYGPDLELFPGGIETQLGERGVNLSGGQKKRLGLSRAHYSSRPIMLLDEAIGALDPDTEKRVMENLFLGEWKNHTRLLVTHRLSVLPHVDRILFLQKGRLVAEGPWRTVRAHPDFEEFIKTLKEDERDF